MAATAKSLDLETTSPPFFCAHLNVVCGVETMDLCLKIHETVSAALHWRGDWHRLSCWQWQWAFPDYHESEVEVLECLAGRQTWFPCHSPLTTPLLVKTFEFKPWCCTFCVFSLVDFFLVSFLCCDEVLEWAFWIFSLRRLQKLGQSECRM